MSCISWPWKTIREFMRRRSDFEEPETSEEQPLNGILSYQPSPQFRYSIQDGEIFNESEFDTSEIRDPEPSHIIQGTSIQHFNNSRRSVDFRSRNDTLHHSKNVDNENGYYHSSDTRPHMENKPGVMLDRSDAPTLSEEGFLPNRVLLLGSSISTDRDAFVHHGLSHPSKTTDGSDVAPSSIRSYGLKRRSELTHHLSQDEIRQNIKSLGTNGESITGVGQQFESRQKEFSRSNPQKTGTLEGQLWDATIEWPQGTSRYFIPQDRLLSIINQNSIREKLQLYLPDNDEARINQLTNTIWTRPAYKIFTILLYIDEGESIFNFLDEGLSDRHLPFSHWSEQTTQSRNLRNVDYNVLYNKSPTPRPIKSIAGWDRHRINLLCTRQWWTLAPIFKRREGKVPHLQLEDCCPLPYIEDEENNDKGENEGGFGSVWGVKVHPAHQGVYKSKEWNGTPWLAIKRLHSKKHDDFRSEVEMLKAFSHKHETPHLIKLLATYKHNNRYHLMFPRARSNLRRYWKTIEIPEFSTETITWVLRQCRGVASGLQAIHNYRITHPKGSESISQGLQATGNTHMFGRHGDIKPENILWSEEYVADVNGVYNDQGLLIIADFGLMEFHSLHSRSRVKPDHLSNSPTYEAPEFRMNTTISQAYDIWSLGCVFLEFVTWLLLGSDYLDFFHEARVGVNIDGVEDDRFYTINASSSDAVVRTTVTEWIQELRKSPRTSAVIADFLDLIEYQMLVINPKNRIKSASLNHRFSEMLDQANKDSSYVEESREILQDKMPRFDGIIHLMSERGQTSKIPLTSSPDRTEGRPIPSHNRPGSFEAFPYSSPITAAPGSTDISSEDDLVDVTFVPNFR